MNVFMRSQLYFSLKQILSEVLTSKNEERQQNVAPLCRSKLQVISTELLMLATQIVSSAPLLWDGSNTGKLLGFLGYGWNIRVGPRTVRPCARLCRLRVS